MTDKNNQLEIMQSFFMQFLQGDSEEIKSYIQTDSLGIDVRLNIYANAYQARFVETIETDHPILGLYLGDELFDKMASGYIKSNPSRFSSLRQYADQLPQYLSETEPFSSHPVIAELALFERFLLTSFDALDITCLSFEQLTQLESEKWPQIQCRFHPSLQIFKSQWNSVEIWNALKKGEQPEMADERIDLYWLVWRNADRLTQFRAMNVIEHSMLIDFLSGKNFAEVCETLTLKMNEEEVPYKAVNILRGWFDEQLVIKF